MLDFFKKRTSDKQKERGAEVYAVIPAAGTSTRMGTGNKLVMELGGMPLLCRTLQVFDACEIIDGIILVCRRQDLRNYAALCADWKIQKVKQLVEGGATREHSVLKGILACGRQVGYVAIHDAARPLITDEIITKTVEQAIRDSAAAPAIPLTDSVGRVESGRIMEHIDRSAFAAVQTPQCFDIDLVRAALTKALDQGTALTDDCGAVEALGQPVTMTEGSRENIKITTPEDLLIGEAILRGRVKKR